ncbi:CAF17-like 4Fe-4S cluster assembly/insertion protein YgfZ [Erythrobacter sp. EC-HK427]|uniref:CAF17-like 4Fe-4S cluster assembly/insertion protein YgfZ n=1 Tax=Erythrobacter sp. EC-HK427 TaxID=2038396 RepID=UPI00125691F6|nr:folate-binding protein YgfZ [Erythrobacter sp. EC-HK427]VVT11994.1 Aminomethyltransferase [Erythrobacter sp. EC-HK427]
MTMGRLTNRAVVRVSPLEPSEDAAAFLQGLLTNDVTGDTPAYAALLSAQGKTLFDMLVWRDGADVLLDCEAALAEELAKRLSLYRLRRKLAIAVDEALGVFWSDTHTEGFTADPRLPALGNRRIGAASEDAAVDDAYLAHRLQLGVPEGRSDMGDILWLETNAVELNGVSFTKGCYIGQENTARMNWRSKVNRRLVVVPLALSQEKRRKVEYPQLGLGVDHLRVEDIPADLVPGWMELTTS